MSIFYRIKPNFAQSLEAVHHVEEGEPYRRPFFVALMLAHVASVPGITQDAIIAATHYMRGIFTPDLRSDPRTALALREAEACENTPRALDLACEARDLVLACRDAVAALDALWIFTDSYGAQGIEAMPRLRAALGFDGPKKGLAEWCQP